MMVHCASDKRNLTCYGIGGGEHSSRTRDRICDDGGRVVEGHRLRRRGFRRRCGFRLPLQSTSSRETRQAGISDVVAKSLSSFELNGCI